MNPDFWKQFTGLLMLADTTEVRLTARGQRELGRRFEQAGLPLQTRMPLKVFLDRYRALLRHERAQALRRDQFRDKSRRPSLANERFLREHLPEEDRALLRPTSGVSSAAGAGEARAPKTARPAFRLVQGGAQGKR